MKAADCQTVVGSADCGGGGYVAGSVRGQSAAQVEFVHPGESTVWSGPVAGGAGLVLSVRVDFDRWAVSSGRARSARAACSVQRPMRLASKS